MPTIILPNRFQMPPYNGDYYKILGLNRESNLVENDITTAFREMSKIYHPDKISTSPVQPPLTITEANECFLALQEIKSILLSNCADVMQKTAESEVSVSKDLKADDLSPGEQLKAYLFAYVRSERFCDYPKGNGPSVPGYWSYIQPGINDTENGRSKYSGNLAIATSKYHVEVTDGEWEIPVTVFDKSTKPFTVVSNPQTITTILKMIADTIPIESRDHCVKLYGHVVREKPTLASTDNHAAMFKKSAYENKKPVLAQAAIKEPYVIRDTQGNNWVDRIQKNPDNSFTILGRNSSNQPRQLTLFQDGKAAGYKPEAPLGIVESQFLTNRTEIFSHFDLNINEEIPAFASQLRPF